MQSVINFPGFENVIFQNPSGKFNFSVAHWEIHAPLHNTIVNMY